ncbi:MAG: DUF2066 domain-containing protein [Rhodospirillaceae bacterium]|jgi:hypothetical protein|nr:DUF2066 domain-containing protein [Rhodospirillaceae bacterium]MBT6404336.1 DUF2066 domain-containing protein [Rhodospirillaceae bacterium]MBT6537112.1 DUF2066 domain-containing protein [Rhodospirillaceae bacterium]MBT7361187.1 DUF2066 domain-containing protein [Rhodospirillaceae bacterium]
MCRALQKFSLALAMWLLAAGVFSVVGSSTLSAQQSALEDIFVVRDVALDESAQTAAAARARALAKGQRQAFAQLEARLTRSVHRGLAANVDADTLRFLVDAIQIDGEKTSDVRYLANLTVTFKPEAVKNLFRQSGVPFAELRSRPLTVVPVLATPARYLLWDDPNPWREAWRNHPGGTGLVPMLAPIGDLEDLSGLTVDQAIDGDPDILARFAQRYGARGVVVTIANIFETEPGILRSDIVSVPVGLPEMSTFSISVAGREAETELDIFARAVGEVREIIEDEWKAASALASGDIAQLRAAVPITSLKNWIDIRARISRVPAVTNIQVIALTATSAEIVINHRGDEARLIRAFERFDLILESTGLGQDVGRPSGNLQTGLRALVTHVVRLAVN